jgi:hypothetical protein
MIMVAMPTFITTIWFLLTDELIQFLFQHLQILQSQMTSVPQATGTVPEVEEVPATAGHHGDRSMEEERGWEVPAQEWVPAVRLTAQTMRASG